MKVALYKGHVEAEAEKWIIEYGRTDFDYEYQKEIFLNGYVAAMKEIFPNCDITMEE